jgi:16S rRNA (adenine1518-N6/adenine1519-N6)-dimethyltransferase
MTEPAFAKKSLGQHWLHNEAALNAMCEAAAVGPGDVVLEIGPGLGTLTEKLVAKEAEVIALEYDAHLIKPLQRKFADYPTTRIWIEEGDIRTYDLGNLVPDYKIVANIPYYLTAYLLRLLTDTPFKPSVAALLVQKEVAERVAAEPGAMSFISVSVQFYYYASLEQVVPARLFTPPPKVDSQILRLERRDTPLFPDVDVKQFFRLAKAGFASRRKTLLNALSGGLQLGKEDAKKVIEAAGINPQGRAQELSLDHWHNLYHSWQKLPQ